VNDGADVSVYADIVWTLDTCEGGEAGFFVAEAEIAIGGVAFDYTCALPGHPDYACSYGTNRVRFDGSNDIFLMAYTEAPDPSAPYASDAVTGGLFTSTSGLGLIDTDTCYLTPGTVIPVAVGEYGHIQTHTYPGGNAVTRRFSFRAGTTLTVAP